MLPKAIEFNARTYRNINQEIWSINTIDLDYDSIEEMIQICCDLAHKLESSEVLTKTQNSKIKMIENIIKKEN